MAKIVVRLQVAVLTQHDEDRRARIGKDAAFDKIEEPLSEVGGQIGLEAQPAFAGLLPERPGLGDARQIGVGGVRRSFGHGRGPRIDGLVAAHSYPPYAPRFCVPLRTRRSRACSTKTAILRNANLCP